MKASGIEGAKKASCIRALGIEGVGYRRRRALKAFSIEGVWGT